MAVNANGLHETEKYRVLNATRILIEQNKVGNLSDAKLTALGTGGGNPPATAAGLLTLILNGATGMPTQEIPQIRACYEAARELIKYNVIDDAFVNGNKANFATFLTAIEGALTDTNYPNPTRFDGGNEFTGTPAKDLSGNSVSIM